MSDYSKREPTAGEIRDRQAYSIASKEDFGAHYDRRESMKEMMSGVFEPEKDKKYLPRSHFFDEAKQNKYQESYDRLMSSPLLSEELMKNTMIYKFVSMILTTSEDPFDSFCEVVSHLKGIEKDRFIQMDTDERNKILGEK